MRFDIIYVVEGTNVEAAFVKKEEADLFCSYLESKSSACYLVKEIRLYYDEKGDSGSRR